MIITDFLKLATRQAAGLLGKPELQRAGHATAALKNEKRLELPRQLQAQLFSCLISNSLIQISSSSKDGAFLWTAPLFPLQSSTWQMFNHVARRSASSLRDMNNFQY